MFVSDAYCSFFDVVRAVAVLTDPYRSSSILFYRNGLKWRDNRWRHRVTQLKTVATHDTVDSATRDDRAMYRGACPNISSVMA